MPSPFYPRERGIDVAVKKFDLNIEQILEDWDIHNGIREIIANAMDEELLSKSKPIEIFKDDKKNWHIRDHGRGLKYEHLTQKENYEKLNNSHTIGKFGIGLKDALATFDRKGVQVLIKSKYGNISLGRAEKHGFKDVVTLHAHISPPTDAKMKGTEFILKNCPDNEVKRAKGLFLRFSNDDIKHTTQYGQIIQKKRNFATIYINGVKVAEEDNFLFSYNITSLTKEIRKALNRERTNVGRTAYSKRVKSILLDCRDNDVINELVADLRNIDKHTHHEELNWTEVSLYACKFLNSYENVVFVTPEQSMNYPDMIDRAKKDNYKIIIVPDKIKNKISNEKDFSGKPIRDFDRYKDEWNESFEFKFIESDKLRKSEKRVFDQTERIIELIGGLPSNVNEIKISKTMRVDPTTFNEANGVWDPNSGRIIIKREQLRRVELYAGTLLHEIAHAESGAPDISSDFEGQLTEYLGKTASDNRKN